MTVKTLQLIPKKEVIDYIRKRLAFDENFEKQLRHIPCEAIRNEHRRFEMSGYEKETGQCTINNLAILNVFADLGIYDFTHYLVLDFYKGQATLYLKYFNDTTNSEFELSGYGTTEIIYEIFLKTIFSNKPKRRRN